MPKSEAQKHRDRLRRKANLETYRAKDRWRYATNPRKREQLRAASRKNLGLPEPTRPCPERCECCGRLPGKHALHLDHDHKTGRFRGWICNRCNAGIGLLGDTIDGLVAAVSYLATA